MEQKDVYAAATALHVAHLRTQWARAGIFTVLNSTSFAFSGKMDEFGIQDNIYRIILSSLLILFNILLLNGAKESNKHKNISLGVLKLIEERSKKLDETFIEYFNSVSYESAKTRTIAGIRLRSYYIYQTIGSLVTAIWFFLFCDALGVLKLPVITIN